MTNTTNNLTSGPKVFINEIIFQKIMHWVNKSDHEVSGLGMVKRMPDGNIQVIDAILLPQRNTSATSDIEPEDVCKAMYELRKAEGEMKFYWHSHVKMNVFWSTTDFDTIKKLSANGWFVSSVFNKRQEMKTCLSTVEPWPAIIDEVQTVILREIDGNLIKAWDADYKRCVTDVLPKPMAPLKSNLPNFVGGGRKSQFPFDCGIGNEWEGFSSGFENSQDFLLRSLDKKKQKQSKKSLNNVTEKGINEMIERRDALEALLVDTDNELSMLSDAGFLNDEQIAKYKA